MSTSDDKKRFWQKKRAPWAIGVAVFLLLAGGAVFAATKATTPSDGVFMQGVSIGPLSVGGRPATEVAAELRMAADSYALKYSLDDAQATILLGAPARTDGRAIALYDIETTISKALALGRETNPIGLAMSRGRAMTVGINIPFRPTSLDREALQTRINELADEHAQAAEDAHLEVTLAADNTPSVEVTPEKRGQTYNVAAALSVSLERIADFSTTPIRLASHPDAPQLRAADLTPLVGAVPAIVAKAPITATLEGEHWTFSQKTIASWLDAVPGTDTKAELGINTDRATEFLREHSAHLASEPKNAAFEMKDGKVTRFEPSVDGREIDYTAAIALFEDQLFGANPGSRPIALSMKPIVPEIPTVAANPYGISEVIGVGSTNFRGSPNNRRHNIAIGAVAVDGTLIPAGGEFSLLKTLGTIDGTTGYLQELVIKENKTTPEYGGGLCQIGSTTFRAVLDSGLPVTVRQNHSYRVPYYERDGDGNFIGPGKDATIYDPAPDFRFLNDTGAAILIRTAISGNRLTFTFWGKRDGRVAAQTASKIYNLVDPPEKKIIETTELPPGEEKCTEHAHVGSDAVFSYLVTYPNGEVKKKDFVSHYKPWQEVCLRGIDPNAPPTAPVPGGTTVPPSADASGATGN